MSPVCGKHQLANILSDIETAKSQGAELIMGGGQATAEDLENGCFVEPTIFDHVVSTMAIAKEEVFGPVLSIMRVNDYDEALSLANDVPYGLSSSIFYHLL
jgi:alpha-ketoglutaric semialdehyde dehydrogenase